MRRALWFWGALQLSVGIWGGALAGDDFVIPIPPNRLEPVEHPAAKAAFDRGIAAARQYPPTVLDEMPVEELKRQGYVFVHRSTGEWMRRISRCEFEFAYRLSTKELDVRQFELPCRVEPSISVRVERLTNGRFRYAYDIANGGSAVQPIAWVRMNAKGVSDIPGSGSLGWVDAHLAPCAECDDARAIEWRPSVAGLEVKPGSRAQDITFDSDDLPGVVAAEVGGGNRHGPDDQPLKEGLPTWLGDLTNDLIANEGKVVVTTVGPAIRRPADGGDSRTEAVRKIVDDMQKANAAGMLGDEVYGRLRPMADRIASNPGDHESVRSLREAVAGSPGIDEAYRSALTLSVPVLLPE
ncbi:MAG: hypothetical protein KIT14_12425 [bacterium]|nr:hypothetical protein [bacterium]